MSPQDKEKQFAFSYGFDIFPDGTRGKDWCKYEKYGWLVNKTIDWNCTRKFNGKNEHFTFAVLEDAFEFICNWQTGPVNGY